MDVGRDHTVLLISSGRLGCTALRQVLTTQRQWHLLADVQESDAVLRIAAETQPDMLLVATEASGADLVTLVAALRARCPAAKIVVIGDLLTTEEHWRLAELHVAAYLLWHTLSVTGLHFSSYPCGGGQCCAGQPGGGATYVHGEI